LQSEKKTNAPAYYKFTNNKSADNDSSIPEEILGILPHSIRGQLSTFSNILPATERFSQCIACSEKVLNEYEAHGTDFIVKVLNSVEHLENITGLSQMADIDDDVSEII
jgi:ubiquitin-like modifier-activating enzyme ATG7